MSIDEARRHALYQRLEQVLGLQEATTFMEHMPPVGWADVATKRDLEIGLDALGTRLDGRIDGVEAKLDGKLDTAVFHQAMSDQLRAMVLVMVGLLTAVAGAAIGLAQLGV